MTRTKRLLWLSLSLLLTALVRTGWLALFPTDPLGPVDAEGFHLLAVNVLKGRGFAIGWEAPFCPTAVRTPLYPLFLMGIYALLGRLPQAVVLVQVLLEVLTAAWVMGLARQIAGPHPFRSMITAGLLYACNGTTQRYTGYLLSEALLLPLITAALCITVRFLKRPLRRRALGSGVLWGLTLLTKPNVQYLVVAIGGLMLLWGWRDERADTRARPSLKRGMVFWGALAICVLPWIVRNRVVLGRWMFSTAFEENVARVSVVATLAEQAGVDAEPWSETWEYLYRRFSATHGLPKTSLSCEMLDERRRQVAQAAKRFVLQHLGLYLRVHLRGVVKSLLDPGHRLWYHVITQRDWSATGVVPDIWDRMAWSLTRGAVGDALRAFWTERAAHIPFTAAMIWWSLVIGRTAVWFLAMRGIGGLRSSPICGLLMLGVVAYHLLLPGPIAYDRFYAPAVPVVSVLVADGLQGIISSATTLLD
ncbi:MAG: glycosyltransferase family 39 protein [Anaerolineae bacterium]